MLQSNPGALLEQDVLLTAESMHSLIHIHPPTHKHRERGGWVHSDTERNRDQNQVCVCMCVCVYIYRHICTYTYRCKYAYMLGKKKH